MTNRNLLSQEGKVTVITGASSGIGRDTAMLFAEYGSTVALLDIDKVNGEKVAEEIRQSGCTASFYLCDVSSDEQCKAAAKAIMSEFERIDTLFNNAGVCKRKNVVDLEEKD